MSTIPTGETQKESPGNDKSYYAMFMDSHGLVMGDDYYTYFNVDYSYGCVRRIRTVPTTLGKSIVPVLSASANTIPTVSTIPTGVYNRRARICSTFGKSLFMVKSMTTMSMLKIPTDNRILLE